MDIAKALAISARTLDAELDQLLIVATGIAARCGDSAQGVRASTPQHIPELADDTADVAVIKRARAHVTGALGLLRLCG